MKKKLLILLIVSMVAVIALLPVVAGIVVENKFKSLVNQVNARNPLSYDFIVKDYQRGWLSSTAYLNVRPKSIFKADDKKNPWILPEPEKKDLIKVTIRHGVGTIVSLNAGKLTADFSAFIKKNFGSKPRRAIVDIAIGFADKHKARLQLTGMNTKECSNIFIVDDIAASAEFSTTLEVSRFTASAGKVDIGILGTLYQIRKAHITGNYSTSVDGLPVEDIRSTVQQFVLSGFYDKIKFTVNDIQSSASLAYDAKYGVHKVEMKAGSATLDQVNVQNIRWIYQLRNINKQAVIDLFKLQGDNRGAARNIASLFSMKTMLQPSASLSRNLNAITGKHDKDKQAELQEIVKRLLSDGLTMSLDANATMSKDRASYSFSWELPGAKALKKDTGKDKGKGKIDYFGLFFRSKMQLHSRIHKQDLLDFFNVVAKTNHYMVAHMFSFSSGKCFAGTKKPKASEWPLANSGLKTPARKQASPAELTEMARKSMEDFVKRKKLKQSGDFYILDQAVDMSKLGNMSKPGKH